MTKLFRIDPFQHPKLQNSETQSTRIRMKMVNDYFHSPFLRSRKENSLSAYKGQIFECIPLSLALRLA